MDASVRTSRKSWKMMKGNMYKSSSMKSVKLLYQICFKRINPTHILIKLKECQFSWGLVTKFSINTLKGSILEIVMKQRQYYLILWYLEESRCLSWKSLYHIATLEDLGTIRSSISKVTLSDSFFWFWKVRPK